MLSDFQGKLRELRPKKQLVANVIDVENELFSVIFVPIYSAKASIYIPMRGPIVTKKDLEDDDDDISLNTYF
jgi:hypothetical protein